MPKEITHFALAATLERSLPRTSLFSGPVRKFFNLFLLGAIAPDIPFYYLAGPSRKRVQELSVPFHRAHERALMPVLAFLEKDMSPPALALAAGVISHLLSDTHFHPLVHYYAGMDGVHRGATGRHRTFETALDIHFWYMFRGETCLNRVVKNSEVSRAELCRLLAGLFNPCSPLAETAPMKALNQHRRIQYLFRAPGIRTGVAGLTRMGRPLPEKISGLAYPFARPVCLPFFARGLFYKDPCTQESVSTDISTMISQSVESSLRVLDMVAQAMAAGRVEVVLGHPGLPGIRPALPVKGFEVWHRKQDIRPLVYQGLFSPF